MCPAKPFYGRFHECNTPASRAEDPATHGTLSDCSRHLHGAAGAAAALERGGGRGTRRAILQGERRRHPGMLQALDWNGSPAPKDGPRLGRLALDLLWHDAVGRDKRQTLGQMLHLNPAQTPPGCRSFSIPTDLDKFAEKVAQVSRQFQVLKLKTGSGNVEFDEAIVATARKAAPDAKLLVDANGGWTVEETAAILPKLVKYDLTLVEQPFHHDGGSESWRELKYLLPSHSIPLYADESAQGPDDVLTLAGLVDGVNVKLLKCGSIAEAQTMIRFARASGMGVLLGCMIESSVGVTAAATWLRLPTGSIWTAICMWRTMTTKAYRMMNKGVSICATSLDWA